MGLPIWITAGGDLGTIAENVYYELDLLAEDTDNQPVTYNFIAGTMPAGIVLHDGTLMGTPSIAGVPALVDLSTIDTFTIRATTTTGSVADRTFTLTVSGEQPPVIATPNGSLGTYLDATYFEYQLDATDEDLSDTLTWDLIAGDLPPGVTLDKNGLLSGWILPTSSLPSEAIPGYDYTAYGEYGFDFNLTSSDTIFTFSVSVFDGKEYDTGNYRIHVESNPIRYPYVSTPSDAIGTVLHDNNYAFQFKGYDFDNEELRFVLEADPSSSNPPGLILDEVTGWLYGALPNQSAIESEHRFGIRVYKLSDPLITSDIVYYTMKIVGNVSNVLNWITPYELTIENGAISNLAIEAEVFDNRVLTYSLYSGSLPDGMELTFNGLLIGRPTFGGFTLDNDTTYFDNRETSFDSSFTFTVLVKDDYSEIYTTREFTIIVDKENTKPYEMLYLVSRPTLKQRAILNNLLSNSDIIPKSAVYRYNDPYYGISADLRMLSLHGTNPAAAEDYINAMEENHQTRVLRFGKFKTARALDDNDNVLYEVVYVDLVDIRNNALGTSVADEIILTNVDSQAIVDRGYPDTRNASGNYVIYPGSIHNMRQQIINEIGQANKNTLPLWMTSKQEDGTKLGLIDAAVICYVNPGESGQILYNIETSEFDIKQISFEVDRYVWDNNLSINFDKDADEFIPGITQGFKYPDENDAYLKFPKYKVYS